MATTTAEQGGVRNAAVLTLVLCFMTAVITTFRMLLRPPEASEVSATRFGSAPPSPRPQRKRIASSAS